MEDGINDDTDYVLDSSKSEAHDTSIEDEDDIENTDDNIKPNRCFLVYENELKALVKRCPKCGEKVDPTIIEESASVDGSQLCLKIQYFAGCKVTWKSQPEMKFIKGLGNLDLVAAVTFTGIPCAKFEKFAWLLNLKCFNSSTFYRLRKEYIAPVIRSAWVKENEKVLLSF